MGSARHRQLERLLEQIDAIESPWLASRGLSALLPFLYDDDSADDTDTDYADSEGAPGLQGLLFYRAAGMEQD
jgi:hypothetical protein